MTFNPKRLSIARKRRMLNKKELAEKTGVADHTIYRCEAGLHEPTDGNVEAFSRALMFPREFFFGGDLEEPSAVSFRSQKAMSSAIREAALSAGAIGFQIADWVEERFTLPPVSVPDLHLYTPEVAAATVRQQWGLGVRPISNMVHLLESKGVRVLSLAENSRTVNAFSTWRQDKPYVFLNNYKSSESSRFDAAHELAHLTLHQDGETTGRKAEDQANAFASEFLMPRDDVLAHVRHVYTVDDLVRYKIRWIVSAAALNYRLHKMGETSDWCYRDFCIELSKRGYNAKEPHEARRERSVVWQKVIKALWCEKVTIAHIAAALHLPETEVDTLLFGILYAGGDEPPAQPKPLELIRSA